MCTNLGLCLWGYFLPIFRMFKDAQNTIVKSFYGHIVTIVVVNFGKYFSTTKCFHRRLWALLQRFFSANKFQCTITNVIDVVKRFGSFSCFFCWYFTNWNRNVSSMHSVYLNLLRNGVIVKIMGCVWKKWMFAPSNEQTCRVPSQFAGTLILPHTLILQLPVFIGSC